MGPLTIGIYELELGNWNAGSGSGTSSDRLLWDPTPGNYIDINASGDNLLINPE